MNGLAYYNENDKRCAAWLRDLIVRGLIPAGDVDDRDIQDVRPDDVRGYTQCHFFAGIGGWAYALRLTGWPDNRPVWTGSCPCQPFSQAGKGGGFDDERHLWPFWHYLIQKCRPARVYGEQSSSKAALRWLDLVQDDMEGEGYAFGAADLCAASVEAPHRRHRIFFMADTDCAGLGARGERGTALGHGQAVGTDRGAGSVAHPRGSGLSERECIPGLQREALGALSRQAAERRGNVDWIACRDGLWRPVESGTFPLADAVPARVVRIRGYGNAIVPQLAAEFILATY